MDPKVESPYFLSKQAHVCIAGGTMFMLDEINGKYLAIEKTQAASFEPFIGNWPIKATSCNAPVFPRALLQRHLITPYPNLGKPATPPTIQLPNVWLRDGQPRGRPRITAKDVYRFAISVSCALHSKKRLPFKNIVSMVQKRKPSTPERRVETDILALLVRVFDWLRPFAFKKTDECFLYCLALNEFLAKYSIHPTWIFAVQEQPFTAHCWLQYGDQALTDIPFNLRRMVPILVL
ncbi:lasso peptide biosynthesis B2 protein [Marinimicrobium locisalis]|uniref:lasso peptide biosynthesis B2 protein n=1 Tax=Marinimicrobium locisalis TaxID=546022 RepID=UPI003221BAE9